MGYPLLPGNPQGVLSEVSLSNKLTALMAVITLYHVVVVMCEEHLLGFELAQDCNRVRFSKIVFFTANT